MWGHSSNHKLIFTAAAEGICETATQPGVAIRSGLKSSCCRARLIFSMLNLKITEVALGSDTTIVVTGDGDQAHQNLRELAATGSGQEQGEDVFRQTGRESLQLSAPRVITAADL
ncbi:regulator of chromosome condensation repeat-containing protein, partial [Cystoisospora suis]